MRIPWSTFKIYWHQGHNLSQIMAISGEGHWVRVSPGDHAQWEWRTPFQIQVRGDNWGSQRRLADTLIHIRNLRGKWVSSGCNKRKILGESKYPHFLLIKDTKARPQLTWGPPVICHDAGPSSGWVQFSCSVMSDSLRPHGLLHARLACPSPTPRACSNPCPSSQWCHSTISPSVVPFSSHIQSFPASGSFPMRQFFTLGGQSTGVSVSPSVLPMNIQDWFPLGLTGLISLKSKGFSRTYLIRYVPLEHSLLPFFSLFFFFARHL